MTRLMLAAIVAWYVEVVAGDDRPRGGLGAVLFGLFVWALYQLAGS